MALNGPGIGQPDPFARLLGGRMVSRPLSGLFRQVRKDGGPGGSSKHIEINVFRFIIGRSSSLAKVGLPACTLTCITGGGTDGGPG